MVDSASTPQRWIAELRRRKVFRVVAVYAIVAWLLIQIAETTFEPMGLPAWTVKLVITLAILGVPLACVLAWTFDVTPKGVERTAEPAFIETVVGKGYRFVADVDAARVEGAEASNVMLAVLPFENLSGDPPYRRYDCGTQPARSGAPIRHWAHVGDSVQGQSKVHCGDRGRTPCPVRG